MKSVFGMHSSVPKLHWFFFFVSLTSPSLFSVASASSLLPPVILGFLFLLDYLNFFFHIKVAFLISPVLFGSFLRLYMKRQYLTVLLPFAEGSD